MSAQWDASTSRLRANSSGGPPTKFQCWAYFAVMRSVRFRRCHRYRSAGAVSAGLRLVARVFQLIELAVERRRVLAQQAGEHLARFLEAIETFLDAAELDAVGARLLFSSRPMPSSSRPLEMMSSAAAILASTAGWR